MLVAAAALAQVSVGQTVLRDAGLEQVPSSVAALSFAEPQALPTRLPARRTTVRVPFTITNDSAALQDYRWSLSAARTGGRAGGLTARPVSGGIAVAPGATVTMDSALRLSCVGGQIRITVRLASPAESIYFLANCPASSPSPK
jgi:hypothetical protein